jgi:hypothetical protein
MNTIRAPIRGRLAAIAGALVLVAGLALAVTTGRPATSPNHVAAIPAPVMVPADCQCGGPGGSADLAHISPWLNSACSSNVEVGRAGVHAYKNVGGSLTDVYVGWAQELYSSNGSCRGYQWTAFHMIMSYVAGTTAASGFAEMIWLSQDPLDWTTFSINYSGGQADGNFWSVAVMAGPLSTTDGIWTSLVKFVPRSDGLFIA